MAIVLVIAAGCRSTRSSVAFAQPTIAQPSFEDSQLHPNANEPSAPTIGLVSHQAGDQTQNADKIDAAIEVDELDNTLAKELDKNSAAAEPDLAETNQQDPVEHDGQASPVPFEVTNKTEIDTSVTDNGGISLGSVLQSVADCYPEISIAIGEIEAASGKTLASWGKFDTIASAHSISQPLGFYQTYRNGVGLSRPLYSGGEVYGTYRIGDGNFEPWYGERETNEGGEFKAGFDLPLLKDRNIDKRRAGVQTAQLQQQQLSANIETRLLNFERLATQAYWDWVANGQAVTIQRQLLELAETRVDQIDKRMAAGDLATIAGIDNDRFIAKRKNGLIKARRGLEKAAIKLSMFYRDASCQPIVADATDLPPNFPSENALLQQQILTDIQTALSNRPEMLELAAARQEAFVKLQYAENLLLPKLDIKGFAGQDVGGETSSTGDKTPFELQFGVFAEVPIERREGAGKVAQARGKIKQLEAKRQLVSDKIRASIQDAASAVNNAAEQILQSKENARLTAQSLRLGRLAFDAGDIDLLALNIYESSVADANLQLLEAQYKYFSGLAKYDTMVRNQAFTQTGSPSN